MEPAPSAGFPASIAPGQENYHAYSIPVGPGSIIQNEGERLSPLQAPSSPFASTINNVWQSQSQGIINRASSK